MMQRGGWLDNLMKSYDVTTGDFVIFGIFAFIIGSVVFWRCFRNPIASVGATNTGHGGRGSCGTATSSPTWAAECDRIHSPELGGGRAKVINC